MKVGLFVGDIKPTDGGGYTYVSGLLDELSRHARTLKHEFVVFHERAAKVTETGAVLQRVSLEREKPGVLTRKERFFGALPGFCGRTWDRALKVSPSLSWDARVYRRYGIEFVLRLVPWNSMTMDIPFGAIVWDLQHRNNPWFPEVCQMAEWSGRERNFATLCQRASIIFTSTRQGMDEIVRFYQVPSQRITVLPFPTPEFALRQQAVPANPQLLDRFGLPKEYLFYPAQFWPHKNHIAVLEACRVVREQAGWNLGVVFAGSEKGNQDYVKQYAASHGLKDVVFFLDYVEQEELVQLYKHAFCLVFATFCGPDNLPPLEAMALQCPVVASAVPGAEEQLGDAALLFPPHDENALAAHILNLRSNPKLRERLIEAGLRRASLYTWKDYVAGMVEALDEFGPIRRAWPI